MDLNELSVSKSNEEGVPMIVSNPATGEDMVNAKGKPMTIYLVGKHSREFRTLQSEIASKYRGDKSPSLSQSKQHGLDLLARCTKRFENLVLDGKEVECSHKTAMELYKKYPLVAAQVDEYIGETTNFLDISAKG